MSVGSTSYAYDDTLAGGCLIGTFSTDSNAYIDGNIDEFRVTKGTARYDGNYTPNLGQ